MGKVLKDFNTMLNDLKKMSAIERIHSANSHNAAGKEANYVVSDIISFMYEIYDYTLPSSVVSGYIVDYTDRFLDTTKQQVLLESDEQERERLNQRKEALIKVRNLMFAPDDKIVAGRK